MQNVKVILWFQKLITHCLLRKNVYVQLFELSMHLDLRVFLTYKT